METDRQTHIVTLAAHAHRELTLHYQIAKGFFSTLYTSVDEPNTERYMQRHICEQGRSALQGYSHIVQFPHILLNVQVDVFSLQ